MEFINGVNSDTAKNILLGAGTVHKDVDMSDLLESLKVTVVGATNGGMELTYEPNFVTVEVDGALVALKGFDQKLGETGSLKVNFAELSETVIKSTMLLDKKETSSVTGYDEFSTKGSIDDSDYWNNIAYVGRTINGRGIIIVMENAICKTGLSIKTSKTEQVTYEGTFECTQDVANSLDTLPIHVFMEKVTP